MQLDSNVVYVHGQNRFCFKFFKYLVVLILSDVIYEEIGWPTFKPKFPVVLLKIGKGQKPEPTSGTKFSEPEFTIIKMVSKCK